MEKDIVFKEKSLLYKIKAIDKLIGRLLFIDFGCLEENIKISNIPSRSQIEIINYILDNMDKDVYQKDLEKALKLRRATISGILGTMEKNGYIQRIVDENDTRTKKILLSPSAKEQYTKAKDYLKNIEKMMIYNITEDEIEVFSKVLEKMIKNLEEEV